jgi:hypothetical protein
MGKECGMHVGKPDGKRLLGKRRCSWEDNIKRARRETRWGGKSRVGAWSNAYTLALRVVEGDKMGCLESETIKYGRESHGTWTRE